MGYIEIANEQLPRQEKRVSISIEKESFDLAAVN